MCVCVCVYVYVCVCVCVCATPGTWPQLKFHLPATDTIGRGKLCAYVLEHNYLDFLKTILCFYHVLYLVHVPYVGIQ